MRLGCPLHLGFIFLPITSNWIWVSYMWYLTDQFLRNLWDGSLLSKIKRFSRPWIFLMSLLFSCLNVKQWPSWPFTAVQLSLMALLQEDCCCFSRIEYGWFFPAFVGARDELTPGLHPSRSVTCAGSVNSLSHRSPDSGQSMKPLLRGRRGAESCHQPQVFPRGERPCT